jgi:hypothetical protein
MSSRKLWKAKIEEASAKRSLQIQLATKTDTAALTRD